MCSFFEIIEISTLLIDNYKNDLSEKEEKKEDNKITSIQDKNLYKEIVGYPQYHELQK